MPNFLHFLTPYVCIASSRDDKVCRFWDVCHKKSLWLKITIFAVLYLGIVIFLLELSKYHVNFILVPFTEPKPQNFSAKNDTFINQNHFDTLQGSITP